MQNTKESKCKYMLTKDNFIKYITEIKKYTDLEDNVNRLFRPYDFLEFSFCGYETFVLEILEDVMQDTETKWISYFIYDLEYGARYVDGMVTDKEYSMLDGVITNKDVSVPLSTIDDLYNLLEANYE